MSDGLDDLLSQAVDQYEKEEGGLDNELDEIFSQCFDILEQKSLEDDAYWWKGAFKLQKVPVRNIYLYAFLLLFVQLLSRFICIGSELRPG